MTERMACGIPDTLGSAEWLKALAAAFASAVLLSLGCTYGPQRRDIR